MKYLLILILFACCDPHKQARMQYKKNEEKLDMTRVRLGYGLIILEIEGHRYFGKRTYGGYVHMESCSCKTKAEGT